MGERLLEDDERLLPLPLLLPLLPRPAVVERRVVVALRLLVAALVATALVVTVWAVTVTAVLLEAAAFAAGAGGAAGAGIAVTGVVGVAAAGVAAGLPEAEVLVARDRGVAMAVMGDARWEVAVERSGPGVVQD